MDYQVTAASRRCRLPGRWPVTGCESAVAQLTLGVMRILSYILIVLGIYLFASALYQEYHGRTFKPLALQLKATGMSANRGYLYSIPVLRDQNPELFHQFMLTHWIYAAVAEIVGCGLYIKNKRNNDL